MAAPQSPEPASSHTHLQRVRSTLPALASAVSPDYYETPKTSRNLKRLAPRLNDFFEDLHRESSDIWSLRSTRNLATPSKASAMYSPVASFHGVRMRAPHVRALTVA